MSGGHFDYKQHQITDICDELEQVLRNPAKWYLSDATVEELRKGLAVLRQAHVYAHRIDYLLSGDDGEESFHQRLAEDLSEINGALRSVCETCDLAEEVDRLRETNTRLNRRVTKAEGIVLAKVQAEGGRSLGRALANAACSALRAEVARMEGLILSYGDGHMFASEELLAKARAIRARQT